MQRYFTLLHALGKILQNMLEDFLQHPQLRRSGAGT